MDPSSPTKPLPASTTQTNPPPSSSPLTTPPAATPEQPSSPPAATPKHPDNHHPSPRSPPSHLDPTILPNLWTCCACHRLQPLLHPGPSPIEPPSHSKFPLSRKPRTADVTADHDRCFSCGVRHCLRCTAHDSRGRNIYNFGGKNLRADRLVPTGEQRKFLIREQGRMVEGRDEGMDDVTRKGEDAEMESQIKEATEDFEAAREEVAKVKNWILAFWDAIRKQERATRMRRETEEAAAAAEGDKEEEEGDGTDDSGSGIL
ncbi:hypothetical protein B0T18DRAFT_423573 [Schizothecium vesticola]|uniref:Uncharacterized protein n=1 Tax=Schizothecium vesticola TaxID=314040 RepID=A0AA40F907_9PEZI|nr:hypothetical protein B0T18DRAFT_423573 [Schizothecium vesticola]